MAITVKLNPNYRAPYAAPTLAASAATRAALGLSGRAISGPGRYGSAAPGGRVTVYGAGGYAGGYPSAAAAFKALSFKGKWVGAAANGPLGYAVKAPLRGRAAGAAYTPGLPAAPTAPRPPAAPAPIAAPAPRPTVITVFSPATVRARLARRARGLPPVYYRVRGKRRVGPTLKPAAYPRVAALGAPRLFSLAA